VPLAHGGVSAGIDVFMRYNQLSHSESSIIYPVRFSIHKLSDKTPILREVEKEYIKDMAKTHTVILFDEDSGMNAKTINGALKYFTRILGTDAYAAINHPCKSAHHLIKSSEFFRQYNTTHL
jgi:hypothetical protein